MLTNPSFILIAIAIILTIASFFTSTFPLLTVSVLLIEVAAILPHA